MAEIAHIRNEGGDWIVRGRYALDVNGKAKGRVVCENGAVFMPPQVGQSSGSDKVVPVLAETVNTATTANVATTRTTTVTETSVTDTTTISDIPAEQVRASMPPLTPRRLRLALVNSGTSLEEVGTALNSIPDTMTRTLALIEWEYANEFERLDPLLAQVASSLGYSDAEIDALWTWALTL